jgi:hypothetical protein
VAAGPAYLQEPTDEFKAIQARQAEFDKAAVSESSRQSRGGGAMWGQGGSRTDVTFGIMFRVR